MRLWRSAPVSSGLAVTTDPPRRASVAPNRSSTIKPPVRVRRLVRVLDSIRVEPWLPCWCSPGCGVIFFSSVVERLAVVQRMKSHGTSPSAMGVIAAVCRASHIARTVRLLRSTLVEADRDRLIKPVILLPASALSGLNPHQLRSHSLA
jgi:hypothetical protein